MKPTPKQSSNTRNNNRTANGKFKKGMSGNPGGRPIKGKTIVDDFRTNPKSYEVVISYSSSNISTLKATIFLIKM